MDLDFDAMLDGGELPETIVPICINGRVHADHQAVLARIQAREAEAQEQEARAGDRLGRRRRAAGDPDAEGDQVELERLAGELRRWTKPFRLRALPQEELVEMLAKHPARIDRKTGRADLRDAKAGFNTTTFFPELLQACIVEPELTPDRWQKLRRKLSGGRWAKLTNAAWDLNVQDDDVPFWPSGSPDHPSSDES